MPVVPSLVETDVRKQPLTVPVLVIENTTADEVDLLPADAEEKAGAGRVDCE